MSELLEFLKVAGTLSPFALVAIAVFALYRGWIIPASVVESIVANTVKTVLESVRRDEEAAVAKISANIIMAVDDIIDKRMKAHEETILREFDRSSKKRD